ncbi:MAG TPA: complex I subunit 1 family protein, partial [Pirellulaceae bacterium]|nr:complex I subunit 1 family protein [Pirellulaceae bacterium]
YTPAHVDKRLYLLAPISILTAALAVFAAVPVGSFLPLPEAWGMGEKVDLVVASGMDVGLIFIFAMSSIAVYGVVLGGWASNNKYSFLGGLRSSAQLISYELPLGLGILGVVLAAGSLDLEKIMQAQASTGVWYAFAQPLGFVVFVIAVFAESARLPFDLPECEQELIGGYHTEYAGLKLLLFLVAEFLHMILASFLISILFLGGWHLWGITGDPHSNNISLVTGILRLIVLSLKICSVIVFFMLVRWSWPRFRFDQLMSLAWKIMLPLGMVNLVALAVFYELRHGIEGGDGTGYELLQMIAAWGVCGAAWFAVAMFNPLVTDNRAQLDLDPSGIDSQL